MLEAYDDHQGISDRTLRMLLVTSWVHKKERNDEEDCRLGRLHVQEDRGERHLLSLDLCLVVHTITCNSMNSGCPHSAIMLDSPCMRSSKKNSSLNLQPPFHIA